jgi:hypothetical protein
MKKTILILLLTLAAGLSVQEKTPAQQPLKPITSLRDLKAGMPQCYVLDGLRKIYRLEEEAPSPSGKIAPSGGWNIWSGQDYVGELLFMDGALKLATISMYQGEGDVALVETLFSVIYDNSGPSHIKEDIAFTR